MFLKSDIIENRSKVSVYEPPKLLFEVLFFYNKYLWGIKTLEAYATFKSFEKNVGIWVVFTTFVSWGSDVDRRYAFAAENQ